MDGIKNTIIGLSVGGTLLVGGVLMAQTVTQNSLFLDTNIQTADIITWGQMTDFYGKPYILYAYKKSPVTTISSLEKTSITQKVKTDYTQKSLLLSGEQKTLYSEISSNIQITSEKESERTMYSRSFSTNISTTSVSEISGTPRFYEENGIWYNIGYGTSTIEDFKEPNLISFFPKALAATFPIGADADEGYENSLDICSGGTSSNWLSGSYYTGFYDPTCMFNASRFNSINIPKASTINTASVTYVTTAARSLDVGVKIEGAAEDNCSALSTSHNPSNISKTTANVATWTIGHINGTYTSPSIVSIIQEIVNRAGWTSGNSLCLTLTKGANSWGHENLLFSDGYSTNASVLTITYTEPVVVETPKAQNLIITE
jgi:hypothetical protein